MANMTTQGYNTGGWDTDKKIEAGVDIQRYESCLLYTSSSLVRRWSMCFR